MSKPTLAVDNEQIAHDPFAELLEVMQEQGMLSYGDDGPSNDVPPPTYHRHPMLNPDFWFFAGGWVFTILPFTSFIPYNSFEPLLFAALILNSVGIACNLTRERQGIIVYEIRRRFAINVRLPRFLGFGHMPTRRPLVEEVSW